MDCFYAEGLRFACTGCRYCCGEEPGYVFISADDLERLCGFMGVSHQEFLRCYCRKVPVGSISYVSLAERENYDCIFLTQQGCMVYEARPVQCATYPFWASILVDRGSWERESENCPGIGKGPTHGKEKIDMALAARKGVEPLVWEEVYRQ